MSDYKHATDRVDRRALAECVECDEYSAILEYKSAVDDDALADLKSFLGDECPHCGGNVGFMQAERPTEVIE